MTDFYVELRYPVHDASPEVLDRHVDLMMGALLVEPGLTDPDVGVNLETGEVDVCVSLSADDQPAALGMALVAIRSAAHNAGAATPGWPGWDAVLRRASTRVRPIELADAKPYASNL